MKRLITNTLALLGVWASYAHGVTVAPPKSLEVPCAVLETYGGQVQILDSTRTKILDLVSKTGIPCGGWVSVESGWVRLKHRSGFTVNASSGSFFNLPDLPAKDSDHLVLLRGQAFIRPEGGSGEVRILTANARVRGSRGEWVVLFSQESEESQLVVLSEVATLENRYQSEGRAVCKAGEVSQLNFKVMQVAPTAPEVVKATAVKQRLAEFRLEDKDVARILRSVKQRQERVFAAHLPQEGKSGPSASGNAEGATEGRPLTVGRVPAGAEGYERYAQDQTNAELNHHLAKKVVGEAENPEELLHPRSETVPPKNAPKKPQRKVSSEKKKVNPEELERAHLMSEISHLVPQKE